MPRRLPDAPLRVSANPVPFRWRRLLGFLLLAFAGLPLAQATVLLKLGGTSAYAVQPDGVTVRITVGSLANQSSTTSGPLRLELWAFPVPYNGTAQSGYRLATVALNALAGGFKYNNIDQIVAYAPPAAGAWNIALLAEEDAGSGYATLDYLDFNGTLPVAGKLISFPWSLARTVTLKNLLVDGSRLYWKILEDESVRSGDKNVGGSTTLYKSASILNSIGTIVQDNVSLYFTRTESLIFSSLLAVPKIGGSVTTVVPYPNDTRLPSAARDALAIAPTGGRLYLNVQMNSPDNPLAFIGSYLGSVSTQGGTVTKYDYVAAGGENTPTWMCTDSVNLYWINIDQTGAHTIRHMPLVGGLITADLAVPVTANFLSAPMVGAAAGSLFWMEGPTANRTLKRRMVGGHVMTVLTGINSSNYAVDRDRVYVSVGEQLSWVSIDGGQPTPLVPIFDTGAADEIVTDGTAVYWTAINVTATAAVIMKFVPADFTTSASAPAIMTQPQSQTIMAGASVTFTVEAGGSPAPTFQWFRNSVAIGGQTGPSLTLNSVQTSAAGTYTVAITNSAGTVTSSAGTLTVNPAVPVPGTSARLVNIATRAYCSTGNSVTIGGFVVSGSASKRVLIRAVGPSLTAQGIGASEVLLDPTIEVHDALHGNVVIATNDNWGDNANAADITSTAATIGASALLGSDTKSSAMLLTLAPGVYSFVVNGKGSTSGIVLLEVYDADSTATGSAFVNIATRAYSTTGNGVTIGGFVIAGNAAKQVLLRAVGPTLTTQGLGATEVLQDPTIELHDANHGNVVIATNDNWGDNANAADIRTTGARIGATPFASTDTTSAALLVTLQPGVYSFIAGGKANSSGIVLVEVYDAD